MQTLLPGLQYMRTSGLRCQAPGEGDKREEADRPDSGAPALEPQGEARRRGEPAVERSGMGCSS